MKMCAASTLGSIFALADCVSDGDRRYILTVPEKSHRPSAVVVDKRAGTGPK